MIEDIMATQAAQTLDVFLRFCKHRCSAGFPWRRTSWGLG